MSRAHHRHLLVRTETRSHEFNRFEPGKTAYVADAEFKIALCGEEGRVGGYGHERIIEEAQAVSCPVCRTKLAKQALKARPADAPKLSLEQDKGAKGGFRHEQGWKARIDGVPVAIIGYQEHSWRVYPYACRKNDDDVLEVVNTYGPMSKDGDTVALGSYFRLRGGALGFNTKEDALIACEGLRASGVLKTAPELIAGHHAMVQANDEWHARRERERAEAATRNRNTLEALREILAKDTLSNFQRQGLMDAIDTFAARNSDHDAVS